MEAYNTAKFDHSAKNRSRDIVLTERCTEKKRKKKKKKNKSKNRRSVFPCRSNYVALAFGKPRNKKRI